MTKSIRKFSRSRSTQAFGAALAVGAGVVTGGVAAERASPARAVRRRHAITIYSSAQPGAISPEYYRPLPGQGTPNAMGVPGYAMVRQERGVQLATGRSQLRFTDVAALIDPTTVTFTSLTDPATRVLEQNFQFDLVSTDKLLLKYIDKPLTVERSTRQQHRARPAARCCRRSMAWCCAATTASITALRDYSALRFPELPGGLITRPTLLWDITRRAAARTRRASPTRPAASPGGRTTT